jgi:hypothetical protein
VIALVCDTPYQLVSAIFLANSISRDEKLLILLNQLWDKTAHQFDIDVSDERIHGILYYGSEQMGMGMLLSGLYNPKKMLLRMEGFDKDIDISCIIASRTTWMATYLYYYFRKKNRNLKMYLIEEGAGEYSAKMLDTRFTRACKMLHKKTHYDFIDAAYFSAPGFYRHKTDFPVHKLPCSESDTDSIRLIDSIFDAQTELNKLVPYTYIFLDEAFHVDETGLGCTQDTILNIMKEVVPPEEIVVKMHPRTDSFRNDGVRAVYSKAPFELLPAHVNMDQKVLVSGISTAMLTSKLLYDQEPYLIFTYHLLEDILDMILPDKEVLQNVRDLMEGVRSMYANKNKTFAPKTTEELKQVLRQIQTELKTAR